VTNEQDNRLHILNALLRTPHRRLHEVHPAHAQAVSEDPRFYVQLAAWHRDHGSVRDHQEMFVVNLALSRFPGHRDVAAALLRGLPPYQIVRIVNFIHGGHRSADRANGLRRNLPRTIRTEIARYLREREADPNWFDSAALTARKALKRLYALLHIRPSDRAQQVLFQRAPPTGSSLYAVKALSRAETPADQARAIVQHNIPYRVAATVVQQMTPAVLAAIINSMSPQELMNNVASLKRRGALAHPQIAALIDSRLAIAASAPRVSALKVKHAVQAAGASGQTRQRLEAVADAQIKKKGVIKRPLALLIDKSASMEAAIEIGKHAGAMLSAVCAAKLYVYAFDTIAYPITPAGKTLADWERALEGITARGATACGAPLEVMLKKRQKVDQIVIITDEADNSSPRLVPSLLKYRQLGIEPRVCIVRTPGGTPVLERLLQRESWPVDVFPFAGDYYSLPDLIPLLTQPTQFDLLMEIMDYPLPQRKTA